MTGKLSLHFDGELRGPLAEHLVRHAKRRDIRPIDLLVRIIETVLGDDIVDAVLDDETGKSA